MSRPQSDKAAARLSEMEEHREEKLGMLSPPQNGRTKLTCCYCTVNPLILSPVGNGAFSSKEHPGNSTRNGRVHRAGFKTRRVPEWCRSSEPAAQIFLLVSAACRDNPERK